MSDFSKSMVRTKKFIRELVYNIKLVTKDYLKRMFSRDKLGILLIYLFNVCFTGFVVHYSLTHFNFLSCGITVALIVYYVEWFVKLVKSKEE